MKSRYDEIWFRARNMAILLLYLRVAETKEWTEDGMSHQIEACYVSLECSCKASIVENEEPTLAKSELS